MLINNAGIVRGASVLSADTANLREELETNLFGPLAVASAFADRIADRRGAIVNVSSVLAWWPVGASYGVSKAALWNATDSMRLELASRGVQVVGVSSADLIVLQVPASRQPSSSRYSREIPWQTGASFGELRSSSSSW